MITILKIALLVHVVLALIVTLILKFDYSTMYMLMMLVACVPEVGVEDKTVGDLKEDNGVGTYLESVQLQSIFVPLLISVPLISVYTLTLIMLNKDSYKGIREYIKLLMKEDDKILRDVEAVFEGAKIIADVNGGL